MDVRTDTYSKTPILCTSGGIGSALELLSNAMGLTCAARMLTVNHYVTPRQVQPLVRRRRAYYIA
jgi:hypothetical protein